MIFDAFALLYIKYFILADFCKVVSIEDDKYLYKLNIPFIKTLFSNKID